MAGSKPRRDSKAGKARASRESRRQAAERNGSGEWFGSGVHGARGLMHLDVRVAGDGLLITSSPVEVDGSPGMWRLRLRDDGSQGLRDLAAAFRSGTAYVLGDQGGASGPVMFFPHPEQPGVGSLVRTRPADPGAEGGTEIVRRADLPLPLWAEAGFAMGPILAALKSGVPSERWDQEDVLACPGCLRPVYGKEASTGVLVGGAFPLVGLCRICVSGQTLRAVRETGVVIPEQQRVVLASLEGARTA
ncbi:hypothetical protein ACIRPK_13820 [Kitasatospora sp. NPDC101801]|uniref:hypothetical protein n=1 Tax=Kitasatospora sp. NPDC101801 TaxID=3364103 RepID=UPI0037F669C3